MTKEVKLEKYVPDYYDGLRDMKELMKTENPLFKDGRIALQRFIQNQFIMQCDIPTLQKYEEMFGLLASANDSIEWRRERILIRINMRPPFSWWFLIRKLDDLFGKGKYSAHVYFAQQELYVESGAETSGLFKESVVLINAIKPANMGYTHVPTATEQLFLKERLFKTNLEFARAGSAIVGVTPLEYESDEKEVFI